jgi:hypothetical protein
MAGRKVLLRKGMQFSEALSEAQKEKDRLATLGKHEKPALLESQKLEEALSRPVSSLKFFGLYHQAARRAVKVLERHKIHTIGDLVSKSEAQLRRMKYLGGDKTIKAINKELARMGLRLGMRKELEEKEKIRILCRKVDAIGLSLLEERDLTFAGITHVFELVQKTEADLRKIKCSDPHTIRDVKKCLKEIGLSLGIRLDEHALREVENTLREAKRLAAIGSAARAIDKLSGDVDTLHKIAKDSALPASVREDATAALKKAAEKGMDISSAIPELATGLGTEGKGGKAKEKPYVRLREGIILETNLPLSTLRTMIRLAKKELCQLLETVRPEPLKVIKEVLDLFGDEKEPGKKKPEGGMFGWANPTA